MSRIQCFTAIAGSIREKIKMDITKGPPPLTDILVKYVFELRRTCPIYLWKKGLTAYSHFKVVNKGSNKKSNFLNGRAIKRGGGKGLREKNKLNFFYLFPW